MASSAGERERKGDEKPRIPVSKKLSTTMADALRYRSSKQIWTFMDGDTGRVKNKNQDTKRNHGYDKMWYMLAVGATMFLTWCITNKEGRGLLPWWYVFTFPMLMIHRSYQYSKRKWQYFMLDLCYWVNLLFFLYLLVPPVGQSGLVFLLIFGMANSTLAAAVIFLKNALVFHSVDKSTSLYIHGMPMLMVFVIRWFPQDCSRLWHVSFRPEEAKSEFASLFVNIDYDEDVHWYVIAVGLPIANAIIHIVHQLFAFFVTHFLSSQPCLKEYLRFAHDEDYLNLYRWTKDTETVSGHAVLNNQFSNHPILGYIIMNGVTSLIASAPLFIWYTYFEANLFLNIIAIASAVWYGANFYIRALSLNYMEPTYELRGGSHTEVLNMKERDGEVSEEEEEDHSQLTSEEDPENQI